MREFLLKAMRQETFWMFTIAGVGLTVSGVILGCIAVNGVPQGAGEIISAVLAAIILTVRDVINAMRARWRIPGDEQS